MTKLLPLLCAVAMLAVNSGPVFAASQKSCFEKHIRESIAINRKNKDQYKKLAGKVAEKVLNTLIASEYLTLIPAKRYDRKAEYFQENGMDLLCQEFASMTYSTVSRSEAPSEAFEQFDWKPFSKKISMALRSNNISEVKRVSRNAIELLNNQPKYHCFTRHMFESVFRIAYFVEIRKNEGQRLGIRSPQKLMQSLISTNLKSFSFAQYLDQLAAPIQKDGIPILCNELPDLLRDLPLTIEQV